MEEAGYCFRRVGGLESDSMWTIPFPALVLLVSGPPVTFQGPEDATVLQLQLYGVNEARIVVIFLVHRELSYFF